MKWVWLIASNAVCEELSGWEGSCHGKTYEYRRDWIRKRMELLASVFGLDVLTYAVMSNHLHIMLRTRPDVVKTWNDEEIAGVGCGSFQVGGSKISWANQPNRTLPMRSETPRRSLSGARDCRISLGSCELWLSRLLGKPIKKTSVLDDFGRDGLRLRRSSTKQDCWHVPCMWISILFEPPLQNRPSIQNSLRPTIGSCRNLGIARSCVRELDAKKEDAATVRKKLEAAIRKNDREETAD